MVTLIPFGVSVELDLPLQPDKRRLIVRHANHFTYDRPVERSVHRLHLRPIHDLWQTLASYKLSITVNTEIIEFEDVFGNWTTRFEINQPYTELSITAESTIELLDTDPFAFAKLSTRPMFPVSWRPWELKMLAPYLAPIELPDTQLDEIYQYALGFMQRNNSDLLETLFAMNLTLNRDFAYQPCSTSLETTPYDVLVNKRGVCQDFANLMICMARMLNIPARYVCGYVYTGNTGVNRAMSDASHAWVQLYLPNIGWKGFDPTNGTLPTTDHVRMAVGRHYRDTAPTAATLYTPAVENLRLDVEVSPAENVVVSV